VEESRKDAIKRRGSIGEKESILSTIVDNPLFLQAIDSLGRVPRYFQFFLTRMMNAKQKEDISNFLRDILNSVVDDVKGAYGTDNWNKFLGGVHKEDHEGTYVGVRTMVLWALSGQKVALTDKLNGITVEEARNTGILMLEEVTGEERYTISMPLTLLRAINKTLKDIDIPDEDLDPVRTINDKEFEKVMTTLRRLRQNMLVKKGRKTATYRELYPHALGYKEDLDQEIPLQELPEVWANGSNAKHESMHNFSMNQVPVLHNQKKTIDMSQGGIFMHNVPMAPSNDGLIVHPPTNIEGIQYKSCDNISRGEYPDPSSQGVLKLGTRKSQKTIWAEFNKVTNSEHKKFYSCLDNAPKFNLFVVSNKPLKDYEKIKKAVDTNDYNNGLPKGVAVICHENFKAYAGSFAHRGLYLPIKRKA